LAFKNAIASYKKKSSLLGEKFFSTRKIDLEQQNKSEDYKNKLKRFKSSDKNRHLIKEKKYSMGDNKVKLYKSFSQSHTGQNKKNKSLVKIMKKLLKKNNKSLFEYIAKYFPEEYNSIEQYYKKEVDGANADIKFMMNKLGKNEFTTHKGNIAKVNIQKRESFVEDKLIAKLKELGVVTPIKTVEVVDMDELENVIYNGGLNASELTGCKQIKEIPVLKVTKKKGE
jgi:hypothetical protein